MGTTKILFYDDAPEFGGHQVMTVAAVRSILEGNANIAVGFIYFEGNGRLRDILNKISADRQRLTLLPIAHSSSRLQNLRTLFSPRKIRSISRIMKDYAPNGIVVAQGRIEACTLGLVAAKKAGVPVVSYIPMAHRVGISGSHRGAAIRDMLNKRYYRLPDAFITLSGNMAEELRARGVTQPVEVVYNGIDTAAYPFRERKKSRAKFLLEADEYALAIVGRIQFKQKGHDFLVRALAHSLPRLGKLRLMIVGSGPDESRLREIIEDCNIDSIVTFVPWSDDLSDVYSAIDMLVIPSRFEGMPIVMLEAMYYGVPIVASAVDGMKEVLPRQWLFEYGNFLSFAEAVCRVQQSDNSELILANKNRIDTDFSQQRFGVDFLKSLLKILSRNKPRALSSGYSTRKGAQ